jgi:organic hydroperoxide reductase OsmC/OhrA
MQPQNKVGYRMKVKPREYHFSTSLEWTEEKKGMLHCEDKPSVTVACPPEFGGHPAIWSPEDLFIGSVEVCTLTTFLFILKKRAIPLNYYRSKARGKATLVDGAFVFETIDLILDIGVNSKDDIHQVIKILEDVPKLCLISNSIRSKVHIDAHINVK